MNRHDVSDAIRTANSTDRVRVLNFASISENAAARCAAALNLHTDWEDLEKLSADATPMIAELAKARIEGLVHLQRLLGDWSEKEMEAGFYAAPADPETVSVVRKLARTSLTEMTFGQAIRLFRAAM